MKILKIENTKIDWTKKKSKAFLCLESVRTYVRSKRIAIYVNQDML